MMKERLNNRCVIALSDDMKRQIEKRQRRERRHNFSDTVRSMLQEIIDKEGTPDQVEKFFIGEEERR